MSIALIFNGLGLIAIFGTAIHRKIVGHLTWPDYVALGFALIVSVWTLPILLPSPPRKTQT
jgi:hypothetical protein